MLDIDTIGVTASRTFVVPNPGGAARAAVETVANHTFFNAPDELLLGSNPLLRVANPLLNMIYQVRTLVHNPDPPQLRNFLIEEIKKFDQRAKEAGVAEESVAAARYCLCTVIDETAAQTPWGGGGVWAKYSLLVTFYNETWGGEKFYQILARVTQTPSVHCDLIELMFFCITLGFEGRYRIVPNGQTQLELLRRRLAEIVAEQKSEKVKALSPHWQGIIKPRPPIWSILPVWVSILFCSIAAAVLFIVFSFKLSDTSDQVFSTILATPIPQYHELAPPVSVEGKISALLHEEVVQGLVTVQEQAGVAVVTLMGDGLFSSGSITLNTNYLPVIKKIGQAIHDYGRGSIVSGHTDNIPIRSGRFPSNWHLSVDRARVVAAGLEAELGLVNAIKVQGMGEAEPIASNATAEGRALNRRVEVKILLNNAK